MRAAREGADIDETPPAPAAAQGGLSAAVRAQALADFQAIAPISDDEPEPDDEPD